MDNLLFLDLHLILISLVSPAVCCQGVEAFYMNCSVTILIGNTWVMKTGLPGTVSSVSSNYHQRQASSSMVCVYTALSLALNLCGCREVPTPLVCEGGR